MQTYSPVTLMLKRWQGGDKQALDKLIPIVYEELRKLASAQLRKDHNASIQCTELVAEAYMKLVDTKAVDWQSRNHFYSIAARVMRRVLVERYRQRNAAKRGNNQTLLTYKDELGSDQSKVVMDLDRIDDALKSLEILDPRQAEIVVLRFFGGLKGEEIAQVLSISTRTVKREWATARLWLFREMNTLSGG